MKAKTTRTKTTGKALYTPSADAPKKRARRAKPEPAPPAVVKPPKKKKKPPVRPKTVFRAKPLERGRIIALDPGNEVGGIVLFDVATARPSKTLSEATNARILSILDRESTADTTLVIESFQPRGQPLYWQLIHTAIWTGRFIETWARRGGAFELIERETVKLAVCGATARKDGNVRAALVDRYGGPNAVGKKKNPGPLYGMKKHAWPALAVAVAYADGARSPDRSAVDPPPSPDGAEPAVVPKKTPKVPRSAPRDRVSRRRR